MSKILLITNRNVVTSSGELRLIKNRSESLYKLYGIQTDSIVFIKKDKINNRNEYIECGGKMTLIPFSLFNFPIFCRNIIKALNKEKYSYVLLSGVGMPIFAKIIKLISGVSVGVDIHGASEDEIFGIEEKSGFFEKTKSKIYYNIDRIGLKYGLKYCDSAFVVTQALKDYIVGLYNVNDKFEFFMVPCATNDCNLNIEQISNSKSFYRKKYNIEDNATVFLYSGGVSKWQCIEQTIELYKRIRECLNEKSYLVIYSQGIEYIKNIAQNTEGCIFDIYSADELQDALSVGDFAFMLRENHPTNNVAFPNKYLEYLKAGCVIITTPHIHDIKRMIEENNVGIIYELNTDVQNLTKMLNCYREMYKNYQYETRLKILNECSFEERLKPFVNMLDKLEGKL